ncbi:glycoside hydrolase family 79 protein [Cadophora sp. DSE1049]|nr:glycoside hydrolase family 79 protein [Cadophora sp. DSE1049]
MLIHTIFISVTFYVASHVKAASVTYPISRSAPANAVKLDPAPVGVSFEFFMWPSYMTNPLEAPLKLTYGPKFFDLIKSYGAETMLGFNRGDDNKTNTYEAVKMAKSKALKHLWAIELGNEPDVYLVIWQYPVATSPWNQEQEGANAADTAFNKTIKDVTKFYQDHLYRSGANTIPRMLRQKTRLDETHCPPPFVPTRAVILHESARHSRHKAVDDFPHSEVT